MNAIDLDMYSIFLISFQVLLEWKPPPFSSASPFLAADGQVYAGSREARSAVQGVSLLPFRYQALP